MFDILLLLSFLNIYSQYNLYGKIAISTGPLGQHGCVERGKGFLASDESAGPWLRAGHAEAAKIPDAWPKSGVRLMGVWAVLAHKMERSYSTSNSVRSDNCTTTSTCC